jgi:hypothetical protein
LALQVHNGDYLNHSVIVSIYDRKREPVHQKAPGAIHVVRPNIGRVLDGVNGRFNLGEEHLAQAGEPFLVPDLRLSQFPISIGVDDNTPHLFFS